MMFLVVPIQTKYLKLHENHYKTLTGKCMLYYETNCDNLILIDKFTPKNMINILG